MKMAISSFFWGGGVSEEVETLVEAPPPLNDQLPRAVNIYAIPPLPEFLDPPQPH